MPGAQGALAEGGEDGFREPEQADAVRDGAAALAYDVGDFFLGTAAHRHEGAVGLGLLDRIEVLALDVLDQSYLEALLRREGADDDGHFGEARHARGPVAALAGHDEVGAVVPPPRPGWAG